MAESGKLLDFPFPIPELGKEGQWLAWLEDIDNETEAADLDCSGEPTDQILVGMDSYNAPDMMKALGNYNRLQVDIYCDETRVMQNQQKHFLGSMLEMNLLY